MSSPAGPELVRWYTRARKFPQLIGRTPDGKRIWGGPYTITQAVTGGALLFLGTHSMRWWAHYGLVGNTLILLGVAYGAVLGLGRIPVGSRNPLAIAAGAGRAACAPGSGRLAGRPVRLRRPHPVRHRLTVLLDPPTPAAADPVAAAAAPDRPAGVAAPAAPAARRRLSGSRLVPAAAAAPPSRPAADPAAPAPVPAPALSGVQALLARTSAPRSSGG